jgi:hypothetical protein
MNTIKFSFDYEKLPIGWNGSQALLVSVYPADIEWTKRAMPAFIEYDTTHRGKTERYPLDFKDGLILVFIHYNTGRVFTTIRRNINEKFEYYLSKIGESFEMRLVEAKP